LSKRFSGTNYLKTTPAPTELSTLEQELGDSPGFAERIQITEKPLIRRESPVYGSWRASTACPSSISSSRMDPINWDENGFPPVGKASR
jgi:hypothetical protein